MSRLRDRLRGRRLGRARSRRLDCAQHADGRGAETAPRAGAANDADDRRRHLPGDGTRGADRPARVALNPREEEPTNTRGTDPSFACILLCGAAGKGCQDDALSDGGLDKRLALALLSGMAQAQSNAPAGKPPVTLQMPALPDPVRVTLDPATTALLVLDY